MLEKREAFADLGSGVDRRIMEEQAEDSTHCRGKRRQIKVAQGRLFTHWLRGMWAETEGLWTCAEVVSDIPRLFSDLSVRDDLSGLLHSRAPASKFLPTGPRASVAGVPTVPGPRAGCLIFGRLQASPVTNDSVSFSSRRALGDRKSVV